MEAKNKLRNAIDRLFLRGPSVPKAYANLLLQCIQACDLEQGKRVQAHMNRYSFRPTDAFLHNRLLQLYAKCGEAHEARQLFDQMPHRDIFSWNSMLSAYSKCGSGQELLEFFDRMPVRDSVSYNTVIAAAVSRGHHEGALRIFIRMGREGCEPSEYTHVSIFNACARLPDLKRGKQVHGHILTSGVKLNAFVWNSLVDMYAKCDEIDEAERLFNALPDKNVVSWNLMISGYLKNGRPAKCIDLFLQMQDFGVQTDLVTVSSVLGAFFQCGLMEEANDIFRAIAETDRVCWTTMIAGYAHNGGEKEALLVFVEMLSKNIRPDSFTMSSVVSACAGLAASSNGKAVHGQVIVTGNEGDLLVSSALVDMYSKCGEVADAWSVFEEMPTKNLVTWNAMIMGYAQNGQDRDALMLYDRMLNENLTPDSVTYVAILSACNHACLIEEGWKHFHSMSEKHGLAPSYDHYACMVHLLGRSGDIGGAVDLIQGMSNKPNSLVWSTLLSVCRINGDIEHGEIAARKLFELDPLDAGPYIMLSNMYAAAGRWKEMASVRYLMKEKSVQKMAACSWIEINNEVHKFVSNDRSQPETEKIYGELEKLAIRLREGGLVHDTTFVLHNVGEKEKIESICYHSEKLALAFGLLKKPQGMPIKIVKNIRVCGDCHLFMKHISLVANRHIILRDSKRFHHFRGGKCSCVDYW